MLGKFILLILSIKIFSIHATDCYTHLLQDTSVSYTCSTSGLFTSSSFNPIVQNPSKELTVAISIRPSSFCSVTSDFNILTVSINTNIGRKKVMMLTYEKTNGKFTFRTEDSTTIHSIQTRNAPTFLATPFNVYLGVNLASGANQFSVGGLMEDGNNVASSTTMSYGSTWVFDSSLRISVCADDDGTNLFDRVECMAQNLKVVYSMYPQSSTIDFANIAKIVGDYKLNDVKKNVLKNSQGSLPSISLTNTATSPTWESDVGLKFTSASQYVQIPGFIPSSDGLTFEVSFAFTFYIKIDSVPTTPATIFSYYSNIASAEIIHLRISSNMKITNYFETNSLEGSIVLTAGKWVQIFIGCISSSGGLGAALIHIDGAQVDSSPNAVRFGASSIFSSADTIKIGSGFIGTVRRFQVYSPGAFQLIADSCSPSTCSVHIGYSDTPLCMFSVCGGTSGTYPSFGTCEKCMTGCATCTDATTCQSCDAKYYQSGTSCLKCPSATYTVSSTSTTCTNCPKHCASCTDSQTCQTCNSGYGLENNLCILCPAGTYLSSDQLCKTISKTVQDTLTNSQLVTSAATQASSVISQGSAVSLSAAVSGKIFSQIKYLNISYSGELQVALLTWLPSFVSLGLTPNMPESTEDRIPERHVPYVFAKYDVPSSFLINFWENLGIIVFVTVLWLLFKGMEMGFDSKYKAWTIVRKGRVFIQNFLITALFGVYGDLVLYSLVEYRSFVFGWNLSLLSFIFSVILLIAMFASFWYQIRLLLNYQKIKNKKEDLEKFTKTHEGSQVLFKDMKDYSLSPQLFLFFLSGRDLIFSLLLATMFEYPVIQSLIFFILTCLMIAYLLIKKPFQSTFDLIQQMFFEIISFAVSICVLINAFLDTGDSIATSARTSLGKTVIAFNIIFNFGTALFMLFMLFSLLKEAYLKYKQKAAKNVKVIKLNSRLHHPLSETNQKSNNIFELSQVSGKDLMINVDSEIDSFHQNSPDIGLDNTEPGSSQQHLNLRKNHSSKILPSGSLIPHQPIPDRIERLPDKRSSYERQFNPLDESQMMVQENLQRVANERSNQSDSLRRERMAWDFKTPEMPSKLKRRR